MRRARNTVCLSVWQGKRRTPSPVGIIKILRTRPHCTLQINMFGPKYSVFNYSSIERVSRATPAGNTSHYDSKSDPLSANYLAYLNVSRIIVKSTNFPSNGTTSEVGGMISANSKKNTVRDSRMDMLSDTWNRMRQSRFEIYFG